MGVQSGQTLQNGSIGRDLRDWMNTFARVLRLDRQVFAELKTSSPRLYRVRVFGFFFLYWISAFLVHLFLELFLSPEPDFWMEIDNPILSNYYFARIIPYFTFFYNGVLFQLAPHSPYIQKVDRRYSREILAWSCLPSILGMCVFNILAIFLFVFNRFTNTWVVVTALLLIVLEVWRFGIILVGFTELGRRQDYISIGIFLSVLGLCANVLAYFGILYTMWGVIGEHYDWVEFTVTYGVVLGTVWLGGWVGVLAFLVWVLSARYQRNIWVLALITGIYYGVIYFIRVMRRSEELEEGEHH